MQVTALHHVSLVVSNTEAALAFYCSVLGFSRNQDRPALDFPGAWLDIGGQQIHLIESGLSARPADPGVAVSRDHHVAFLVDALEELKQALAAAGVSYSESRRRPALFCRDPDGNGLEFIERE